MPPPSLASTLPSSLPTFSPLNEPHLRSPNNVPFQLNSSHFIPRCSLLSVSTASHPLPSSIELRSKPSPAENSRTIMELSSSGTFSTFTSDGWPIGIGAQFVVDAEGSPALCLEDHDRFFAADGRSSFHVQEGIWVTSTEYLNAEPDPIRNFTEKIVDEMNSQHIEDVQRLCKVYVDPEFQVTDTKIIWIDRLGFDVYMYSEKGVFAARIPFPREVTDEKGVKSSFNSMSHLAWEIERSYVLPDFEKVKCLKKIR